jgi:hypothetical protein
MPGYLFGFPKAPPDGIKILTSVLINVNELHELVPTKLKWFQILAQFLSYTVIWVHTNKQSSHIVKFFQIFVYA